MEKVVWRIAGTLLLVVVITAGSFRVARARGDYLERFNEKYGTYETPLNNCITCHVSSNPDDNGERNPYGVHFGDYGLDFSAIEHMDSDLDGFSNRAEIWARTFPGDPESVPVKDGGCFITTASFGLASPLRAAATCIEIAIFIWLPSIIAIGLAVRSIKRKQVARPL